MSGGRGMAALPAVILQNGSEVGGIEVPEPADSFIETFNREYARLGMRIVVKANRCPMPARSPWSELHPRLKMLANESTPYISD